MRARVDDELHRRITEQAEGRTVTDVVRTALHVYLAVVAALEESGA